MNKHITELVDQAGIEFTQDYAHWGTETATINQLQLEKFAQLLVVACADWTARSRVLDKGHVPQDPHSRGWNQAVAYASHEVLVRFGAK